MTTFVTWVWQGLAIAALTAILVRAVPRLNAATRHVIWWLALVVVLIQPWTTAAPTAGVSAAQSAGELTPGTAAEVLRLPTLHLPAPPEWVVLSALALWAGLAGFSLWRMAAGIRLMRSLKNNSRQLEPSRQDRLPLWKSLRDGGRPAELRISDAATTPCALGLGRPVILIPSRLAATLPDRDLDLIVTHEHAHLARYDDWLRLLQCAVVAAAGIHPAVRWIARQIDLEREVACDDRVVIRAGDPRSYAHCLATVAGLVTQINPVAAAVAPLAVRSGSRLRARVTRLLDHRSNRTPRLARCATMATAAMLLLAVLASDRIPALVVVGDLRADARSESPVLSAAPFAAMFTMFSAAPVTSPSTLPSVAPDRDTDTVVDVPEPVASPDQPATRSVPLRARAGAQQLGQPVTTQMVQRPDDHESGAPLLLDSRLLTPALSLSSFDLAADDPEDPRDGGSEQAAGLAERGVAAGQQMRRLGQSVGSSSRRAGTSVGRFFSRAGKSIASGF